MRVAVLTLVSLAVASAQAFEAASVRPHQASDGRERIGIMPSGTRLAISAMSLRGLVAYAYGLQSYQLSVPPGWEDSDTWDINAKAEGDAALSSDQFRAAMRSLLANRFDLRFHRETKDLPVYVLRTGKNTPRLKENTDPNARSSMTVRRPTPAITAVFTKASIDLLVNQLLSHQADQPVLNQTGLTGTYDFTLTWTPGGGNPGEPAANASVLDAVEEQLGLKVQAEKAPAEMLIVDHAQKPSEN